MNKKVKKNKQTKQNMSSIDLSPHFVSINLHIAHSLQYNDYYFTIIRLLTAIFYLFLFQITRRAFQANLYKCDNFKKMFFT